jgi:hypothetical protein
LTDPGTFAWHITKTGGGGIADITDAAIDLYPTLTGTFVQIDLIADGFSGSKTDVPAGNYEVIVRLTKGTDAAAVVAEYYTAAFVSPNLTTSLGTSDNPYTFTDDNFVGAAILSGQVTINKPDTTPLPTGSTITVKAWNHDAGTKTFIESVSFSASAFTGAVTGTSDKWYMAVPITGLPLDKKPYFTIDYNDGATTYTSDMGQFGEVTNKGLSGINSILYSITTAAGITNGTVSASRPLAVAGETITLAVTPEANYKITPGSVKWNDGTDHTFTSEPYTFTMPAGNVTISAEFEPATEFFVSGADVLPAGDDTNGNGTAALPFASVSKALIKIGESTEPAGTLFTITISGTVDSSSGNMDTALVRFNGASNPKSFDFKLQGLSAGTPGILDATGSGKRALHIDGPDVTLGNNLTIKGGNISEGGGGVRVDSGSFTMSGGTITGNTAPSGGGVYVNGGSFVMTAGSIGGNTATGNGKGIYVGGGTFTMKGSSKVAANNEVYLASTSSLITIDGNLTGTSPVATIDVDDYTSAYGRQVLAGNFADSSNYTKFVVAEAGWGVDSDGKLAQTAAAIIFNFTGPADESFSIGAITTPISWAANSQLDFTVNTPYSSYQWYADGVELTGKTSQTLTMYARDFSTANHRVSVKVTTGASEYSKEIQFTVTN